MTEPTQSPAGAYMGTCIHESSHAGAAHLLGMNVECVRIAEDGSGEMGLTPVASTHPPPVETAEREIQIAQAGAIAEYRYCEAVGYPEDKGRHTSWGEKPDKKRGMGSSPESHNPTRLKRKDWSNDYARSLWPRLTGTGRQLTA